MAVMATPAFEKSPVDLKASAFAPADAMAVDHEANGIPGVRLNDSDSNPNPATDLAQPKPTLNGTHGPSDTSAPAMEPTTNVSGGIDGVAQFLPDSQQETSSLFGDSDVMATMATAIEAPTSGVRDEPATTEELLTATQATSESTQHVPETQLEPSEDPTTDAMDITADAPQAPKTEEAAGPPTKPMNDLSIEPDSAAATQFESTQSPALVDREMEDAPSTGKVRPREDDEDEVPDAKRTKTEDELTNRPGFKIPDVPAPVEQPNGTGAGTAISADPSQEQESSGILKAVDYEAWPTTVITEAQSKFLLERIRNTKKIKVSLAFKDPVNAVALGIPTYPEIVKNPMDLSTMENKLKDKQYQYIREFMGDLDQMIENSELFNNKQHPVTQAGYNLRAYFLKGMGKMPRAGAEEPKQTKAKKPVVNTAPKPRRESRVVPPTIKSPAAPTPTATSPQAAWPLQQDGTPLIRRDSSTTDGRPKREIHRPSKDLPYSNAKPRRKKYQQELKFCEGVLTEIMKPKHAAFSFPFTSPVDPVALNIPSYLKIIKKPMDFGTIEKNLKNGVYQNAKDFHSDAQLVFLNCYKFNPEADAVNKMGHQLEELFERLWKDKTEWLAQNAPAPEQSPSDLYSSNDEDDEEEEEAEPVAPNQDKILAIQQQIDALQATAQQLLQQASGGKHASAKPPGKKKKAAVPAKRKSLPLAVPPPPKPSKPVKRAKAPAPLSFAQKQEISEGISTLGDSDMRRAVQIIRNGCPHLASVHDDEMELDMDEINDETLRELFKFIKSLRGPKADHVADDDFEPPRQVPKQAVNRPKKNKPMGKTEQEDNMRKIQEKLNAFQGGVSGSSQSPPAHDASSDDDDESSGSESEEE